MINDTIKEKIDFYFKNKTLVHIEKDNGQWFNGIILECSDKHLILFDKIVRNVFIYFSEITKLEPFKERRE
ncbi:MAG: hypothetical protein WD876_02205 [Candidatus Pacearchaeota archaeon]